MSRPVAPIVCDGPGCTNRKQETNRWWQIGVDERANLVARPADVGIRPNAFRLAIFDSAELQANMEWDGWTWYDACGETCVLKFISEQMSKVTS
jgi:hypothetical protein